MKKEYIEKYNKGEIQDRASHIESAFSGVVIVEINHDEEKVFGYYFYPCKEETKKAFFYVKLHYADRDYFIVNGIRYYTNEFTSSGL